MKNAKENENASYKITSCNSYDKHSKRYHYKMKNTKALMNKFNSYIRRWGNHRNNVVAAALQPQNQAANSSAATITYIGRKLSDLLTTHSSI